MRNTVWQICCANIALLIIFIALSDVGVLRAAEEEVVEKESVAEKEDTGSLPEPGYEVPDDAGNPFQDITVEKQEQATTLEQAVKELRFAGFAISSAYSGFATINGELYQPGDTIEVDVDGENTAIKLDRFETEESAVVFISDGEEKKVFLEDE